MNDFQARARAQLLARLRLLVAERGGGDLFPCIEALVGKGLDLPRWKAEGGVPSRHDVVQYLAAWGRFVGLDEESCRAWLTDYALRILAAVSGSSASAIRHNTKSLVRYIYRSEIPFVCERERNPVRAPCDSQCPVYEAMAGKTREGELARIRPRPEPTPPAVRVPVKQRYRKEFEAALDVVRDGLARGESRVDILRRLNKQGMKTRTGRPWTYTNLHREMLRLRPGRSGDAELHCPASDESPLQGG